jgi:hypothetical protein
MKQTSVVGSFVGLVLVFAAGCGGGSEPLGAGSQEVESPARDGSDSASNLERQRERGSRSDTDSNDADDANASNGADDSNDSDGSNESDDSPANATDDLTDPGLVDNPLTHPDLGPAAGNPGGGCAIPNEALPVDTSATDNVVGDGDPDSCTGDAVIAAVERGGLIRFDCGPDPIVITLDRPAKVKNDASDDVVIDGGGKVTLSGGGTTRILYMNTCDPDRVWTTDHCDNQETPRLTVQNITFADGNSKNEGEYDGGGAIWVRGGRFKIINSRFFNNTCADDGPDVGGAGVRVFSQFDGEPVYVVNSTFGGAEGFGNVCSNGGGLSSIDVSWRILNSVFSHNRAVGEGGNPAEAGTPGGGSGGAIYNDGNTMTLSVCGTRIEHNQVNAYGSAIFFVSNNHDGTLDVTDSVIKSNQGGGWNVLPGISMHEDTTQSTLGSIIE